MLQVFLRLPSQITWPILLQRLQYNRKGQNVLGSLLNIASKFDSRQSSPDFNYNIVRCTIDQYTMYNVHGILVDWLLAHMSDNRLVQVTCNWGVGTLRLIFRGENRYLKNIARIANAVQVTLWLSVNHLNRCLCSHCRQCLQVSTSVY